MTGIQSICDYCEMLARIRGRTVMKSWKRSQLLSLLLLISILSLGQAQSPDPPPDKYVRYFEPNSVVALTSSSAAGKTTSTGISMMGAMGLPAPVGDASGPGVYCLPGFYASFVGYNEVVDAPEMPALLTSLMQNHPNPFNPATSIGFTLQEPAFVSLEIYDLRGKRIRALVHEEYGTGPHEVVWDGRDDAGEIQPSGTYLYRIHAGEFTDTKKLMVLK
jgi:hypothetical protein